jgi:hypothetical protein
MQLPRGTFQGIKKDISWADLLEELRSMRFTGSVSIEVDKTVVNLVFRKGKIILSEFGSEKGDAVLERMKGLGDRKLDAILSDMTDPQLSLALEFNPESRIQNISRSRTVTEEKAIKIPVQPAAPKEVPQKTAAPEMEIPAPPFSPPVPSEVVSLVKAIEGNHIREKQEIPAPEAMPGPVRKKNSQQNPVINLEEDENDESVARDLKALEAMDLEGMAEKIRNNCRLMVEKLNLGHLIDHENQE